MSRTSLTCTLIALAIGGCRAPDPAERSDPAEPPPEPATASAERLAECSNPAWGYGIAYPESWHTNPGDFVPECSLFDPRPIAVEPRTELPLDLAVIVRREPVASAIITGEQLGRRVLSREQLTLDARETVRMETQSTGEAMLPAGVRSYHYVIDLNGAALILATHELGDLPYEIKKARLAEMAATLRFHADREASAVPP